MNAVAIRPQRGRDAAARDGGPRIEVILDAELDRPNYCRVKRERGRERHHQFCDGGLHLGQTVAHGAGSSLMPWSWSPNEAAVRVPLAPYEELSFQNEDRQAEHYDPEQVERPAGDASYLCLVHAPLNHSSNDADRAKAGLPSLYSFDAVPFWLIPASWPHALFASEPMKKRKTETANE